MFDRVVIVNGWKQGSNGLLTAGNLIQKPKEEKRYHYEVRLFIAGQKDKIVVGDVIYINVVNVSCLLHFNYVINIIHFANTSNLITIYEPKKKLSSWKQRGGPQSLLLSL